MFEKNEQQVCLIHIPRNGGRHVTSLLKMNSFSLAKETLHWYNSFVYKKTEYMHLTYDMFQEAHPETKCTKRIVIVRDPVERFKSLVNSEWSMKLYFEGYENFYLMNDPTYFKYVMKEKPYSLRTNTINFKFKGLSNTFSNWFRPQVEFFNDDFYVWKFENGFGDEFIKFLTEKVNLDINTNVKDTYVKKSYDEKIKDFSISEELKCNILNFYRKDYDFWKQL